MHRGEGVGPSGGLPSPAASDDDNLNDNLDDDDIFAGLDDDNLNDESPTANETTEEVNESNEANEANGLNEVAMNEADGKKGKRRKKKRLDWVKEPNKFLYLDVFKAGRLISQVPLGGKSRYVFGRAKEGVDVITVHPSLSRQHAAICHGVPPGLPNSEGGTVTLLDLKTLNGTFYSLVYPCKGSARQRLAAGMGVVLKEKMCFKLGESSRSYVVRGIASNTAKKFGNPNFEKKPEIRDVQMSRDLGLEEGTKKRKLGIGVARSNPFRETNHSVNQTNTMLPTLNVAVAPKLVAGETTFSFHDRAKTERDQIRYNNEFLKRKRVQEELRKLKESKIP